MTISTLQKKFSPALLRWFDVHGRKNLPWQHPRSPYRVWIAEIMLQQTQVQTVIPYFQRFMARFPDIHTLCEAPEDIILAHWSGLGYYTRARNIHQTAKIICDQYQGHFPSQLDQLVSLPGIGPSTAAAISSQAFNQPTAILDGNVVRVLSRYFRVDGWHGLSQVKKKLWQLAEECMSHERCADYTQAIMDLGATCCTRTPNCTQCPLQKTCAAYLNNMIALYPFKKVKKIPPTKHQQFLLLHTATDAIYLEKRPPSGIWGGLWCLPVLESEEDPALSIARIYGLECLSIHLMETIKHSFSHFHLFINPLAIKVQPLSDTIYSSKGQWFHSDELRHLGLAKPVTQIINHFLTRK